MKATANTLRSTLFILSTLVAANACSDADETWSEGEADLAGEADEAEGSEELGELSLALNSNLNCGTASADKTYNPIISPTFTSPSSYSAGNNGCGFAYFVRVNNYRSGNTAKTNFFKFAGANPSTEAGCRDTRLMVYAFEKKADGSTSFIGSKSVTGEPAFFIDSGEYMECILPSIHVDGQCSDLPAPFSLTTGKNYQFAVSARTNNSGTPVMKPIQMGSSDRFRCVPR